MAQASQNNSTFSALAIVSLIAGIALLLWYFLRKKATEAIQPVLTVTPTVNDKIATGFAANMAKLSEDEIKKYAANLNAANSIAFQYLDKEGSDTTFNQQLKAVNDLATGSLKDGFADVVNYWKSTNGITNVNETNIIKAKLLGTSMVERNIFYGHVIAIVGGR